MFKINLKNNLKFLVQKKLFFSKIIFVFPFILFLFACGNQTGPSNILGTPKVLSIDNINNRLFIVDAQNNSLSLINTTNNSIVTGAPLLNQNSTLQVPQLPQGVAVVDLGNGITRLFIIGNGPVPRNRVIVFDYSSNNGLIAASISPIIVGTDTAADQSDILGGVIVDPTSNTLFVSNSTDGIVRAYDVNSGTEKTNAPGIAVNTTPQGMGLDTKIHRLFVSSLDTNLISIINTQDLTQVPVSLDVNANTSDIASSTNATGTALFAINPITNQISVFNFNVATPNSSTLIGAVITPPNPGATIDSNTILTGTVAQVASANLSDNRIVGTITQSTGDLAVIDVSADLLSYSAVRVSVLSGLGAYGVEILTDSSGNGNIAYFVSVSAGALSLVNVITNQYSGQVL